MSNTFVCPPEICELFVTEELAETQGRRAALDWALSLTLLMGDKIMMPDNTDGFIRMVELTKITPGVQ